MTITDKVKILATIREEIREATGHRYGQWTCSCGSKKPPYYKDARNSRTPMCVPCGKMMTFQDLA